LVHTILFTRYVKNLCILIIFSMTCMMVNFSMVLKLLLKGMLIKTFFFLFFNDIVGCYQGCQPQIYQDFIGNRIQPIIFFFLVLLMLKLKLQITLFTLYMYLVLSLNFDINIIIIFLNQSKKETKLGNYN